MIAMPERLGGRDPSPVNLSDFSNAEFICLQKGKSLRSITDVYFQMAGFSPNISLESDSPQTVREFVRAGVGLSLIPGITWSSVRGRPDHAAARGVTEMSALYRHQLAGKPERSGGDGAAQRFSDGALPGLRRGGRKKEGKSITRSYKTPPAVCRRGLHAAQARSACVIESMHAFSSAVRE